MLAAASEFAGLLVRGFEWSLLPSHTPTARPAAAGSFGGARNPYVARSRTSSVVPVLAAAGRRDPSFVLCNARAVAQTGFCLGSLLPARMSAMRNAAPGEIACVGSGD